MIALMKRILSVSGPYQGRIKLAFVFASAPNTYVYQLPELNITDITYDATTITCDLAAADFRLEAFPGVQFYPSIFPGLFS